MGSSVSIQLVEVSQAHGQVCVGEELVGFSFGAVGQQYVYVFLDGALL